MMLHRSSAALSAALMLGLGLPGAAFAHAHLTASSPAADAVVSAAPAALRLTFSEGLELRFTGVSLSGPDGVPVGAEPPVLDPASGAVLVLRLRGSLAPGRYTVTWHATATDTHRTKGSYGFTVKP